jgi:hypothetical protein
VSGDGGALQPVQPPNDELDAVRRQLEEAREQMVRTATAIDTSMQKQEADDRSMITRVVIQVFGYSLGGVLLVIAGLAMLSGEHREAQASAIDLLKSVVLPIVTLVLGYYFGRAGKG